MTDNKLRMDAYYYGFDETGQPDIDLILSAVACAGKSFHHTDQWNDEDSPWPGHSGNSPIEWIANAALSAAQEMARLKAENEALRSAALAAREFIMHEAEVRGLLDETGQVSHRHPRRQAAIASIDAAMAKEAAHG